MARLCGLALALLPQSAFCGGAALELAAAGIVEPVSAAIEAENNWSDTLTGDWNSRRARLHGMGFDFGGVHRSDFLSNRRGGLRRGSGRISYTEAHVGIDGERWLDWEGTTALLSYHFTSGAKFNRDYVGAQLGVDNIEVAETTGQFFDAWIQKTLLNGKGSVLAGLYHVDSEFYVTDSAGVLIQPPYGMANEVAQSGRNGPPVYPMAALSLRLKYETETGYAQAAVSDGVPGDPDRLRGTHVRLGRGDGSFLIAEAGLMFTDPATGAACPDCERFGKLAFGIWRFTARMEDFSGQDTYPSHGLYLLGERTLWTAGAESREAVAGFVRYGSASARVNPVDRTASLGLRWSAPFSGRPDDVAAIALNVNRAGEPYFRSGAYRRTETALELTYRMALLPWLAVQPMLHYLRAPGFDPVAASAVVVGTRVEVSF